MTNDPTWHLRDVEQDARAAPTTFFIPSAKVRHTLRPGDLVKLIFVLDAESVGRQTGERMWVEVVAADGDTYLGRLRNDPTVIRGLAFDSPVNFRPEHVASVAAPTETVGYDVDADGLVSRRVRDRGRQPFRVYHEPARGERDSGWRILAGDETEAYLRDLQNIITWPLGYLVDKFPALDTVFKEPGDSAWEWDPDAAAYRLTHRRR